MKTLRTTLIIAAVSASFAVSAPLLADTRATAQNISETVQYSDLNLSTRQGVQTLYVRLQTVAWHVCEQLGAGSGPDGIASAMCRRGLVQAAVRKVNNPSLTALSDGKPLPGVLSVAR
jgi:UrcA family protein